MQRLRVFYIGEKKTILLVLDVQPIPSTASIHLTHTDQALFVLDYFLPNTTVTKQEFQSEINRLALFMVYLFIAKFFLSYISLFTVRISGLRISAALRLAYLRATFAQPVSVIDTVSISKRCFSKYHVLTQCACYIGIARKSLNAYNHLIEYNPTRYLATTGSSLPIACFYNWPLRGGLYKRPNSYPHC